LRIGKWLEGIAVLSEVVVMKKQNKSDEKSTYRSGVRQTSGRAFGTESRALINE